MSKSIKLTSTIRCPICKYKSDVQMPLYTLRVLYDCEVCKARLKPKPEGCCVFCSYGSHPCPSVQLERIEEEK